MIPAEVIRGDGPVVLGLPHTGTFVPPEIMADLNPRGQSLADTDWHIHRLYDGVLPGATTVRATFHRYVIDANRAPDGESLYPGQNTTGLVPMTDFDGHDLWTRTPDKEDIAARLQAYHAPYHAALQAELERVHALHGVALLYDCHSIRSHVPFLFDGTLPDFNIGTDGGTTCDPRLERAAVDVCAEAAPFTHVLNGRFKGGWTTRHYGNPRRGLHAIQMELAQSTHLAQERPPFDLSPEKAAHLRPVLAQVLGQLAATVLELRG